MTKEDLEQYGTVEVFEASTKELKVKIVDYDGKNQNPLVIVDEIRTAHGDTYPKMTVMESTETTFECVLAKEEVV